MSQFNNLNVLPFYTDLKYQTRNKWYAFGAIWGLASPANSILPFQLSLPYNLTSVESFQVKNLDNSTAYSPSAKPSINNSKFSTRGYSIVKLVETAFDGSYKLPIGTYYIEMKLKDSGNTTYTYYSEVFTVVNNISDFLKIQYWNEDNMYYSSGEINYEDNFKFTMYLCATIGKPEYEFEEELTKRGGYPFLESQISSKLYKFAFIAPEFICDAMRLIRMSDYIRISSNGLDYNALTFSYEPNWEEQGDLASVQAEFTVDDIIQKLASFNRRVKESFYNALLADVNEPMMFDAESIAQHYKSALGGATANLVNGLLIRELEELKAYKQDYYAVLDTGEGAAKKILLSNLLAGIAGNIDTSNFVTTDQTEQSIFGVKTFLNGFAVGNENKIKVYEKDGALFIDGNLALTGALTMYASNGQSFDTIYDGLPIDNDTIYWQEVDGSRVLKAREGSGSSFDKSAMWTALAGSTTEQINKSHLTTALTGCATESWVSGKNYAVKATTLAGYGITDGVNDVSVTGTGNAVTDASVKGHILTLTKGSTFSLSGHKHAWADITSGKPTTLSGYGITDAYTMTESDNKYPTKTGSGASGTWGIGITGNAGSATKLQTTCNLWGHSFNGQQNISGDLTGVGKIKYNNGEFFDEYGNMHLPTSLETNYWTIFNSNGAELIKVNGIGGIIGSAFRADNWYRSTGNTGWQNETYGGGWYMQDSSYIRSYNNKSIHIGSGSYITANGGYKVNNDVNTSEVWNCRYIVESLSVPAGNVRNILGWYDSSSSGYTTSYIIGSKREIGNNWGELMLGVYQYEDAKRSVAVYMGLDGAGGRVYIGGNLLVTGGGTFYGSDIRYKSIMQQVNLSLLDIAKAPSFVYRWNKKGMKRDRLNLGGSAQYTQSILPWAVEEKENFLSMDYATVAYTFSVHTARHLLTYESRTDKKIKKLENRVKYLEKQLKKLGYEEAGIVDDQSV